MAYTGCARVADAEMSEEAVTPSRLVRLVCLVAIALVASKPVLSPGGATAARPGTYQVKKCYLYSFGGNMPLRYGNRRFGYRHIRARHNWSAAMDRLISKTLAMPERYVPHGDRWTLLRYRPHRVEIVVVGLNLIPHAHDGDQVIGVITAYKKRWDGRRKRGDPPNNPGGGEPVCSG
jgi:hypothetical protein